ncbi:hypothetical protein [Filimonas lacunae]|uniref:hypothetical protein n=1 Tax=Filimonas lacunae TaxID=477680 RepID=UPI0007D7352B|nr:hypothetical protein [Filimonas lacunae]BAV04719.1 hypothetical protein FLA_0718 [Filimonas lacunae]
MNSLPGGGFNAQLGFAGGLCVTVLATANSHEVCKTVILAAIGAVVSYTVSMLMKCVVEWYKQRKR